MNVNANVTLAFGLIAIMKEPARHVKFGIKIYHKDTKKMELLYIKYFSSYVKDDLYSYRMKLLGNDSKFLYSGNIYK
jgi:hypothetical protein